MSLAPTSPSLRVLHQPALPGVPTSSDLFVRSVETVTIATGAFAFDIGVVAANELRPLSYVSVAVTTGQFTSDATLTIKSANHFPGDLISIDYSPSDIPVGRIISVVEDKGSTTLATLSNTSSGVLRIGMGATGSWSVVESQEYISPGTLQALTLGAVQGSNMSALTVYDTTTSLPRGISNVQVNTGTESANISGYKARGIPTAMTTIVTGDLLANFRAWGYDGSNYLNSGSIRWTSEGTIAATRVPTKLELMVATDATPSVLTTTASFSGKDGIQLTAVGSNQSITLTPSGAGGVIIPSTVTTGLVLANTADVAINYERLELFWSGNVGTIRTLNGGTGTARTMRLGSTVGVNASYLDMTRNPSLNFANGSTLSDTRFTISSDSNSAEYQKGGNGTTQTFVGLTPKYNQTGSAAATDFLINRTETAVGSGTQRFVDLQVAGTTKFNIYNDGTILAGGLATKGTGVLQFAAGTTSAAGIVFGADTGFYRLVAGHMCVDSIGASAPIFSLRENGTTTGQFFTSSGTATLRTSTAASLVLATNSTAAITLNSSQNATFAGVVFESNDTLSGAGAVSVTKTLTKFTSTGASQALTLADGTNGQIKRIIHDVDGGSGVLTPTTKTGYTTITFTNAGDSATLQFVTTSGWIVVSSFGAVIA